MSAPNWFATLPRSISGVPRNLLAQYMTQGTYELSAQLAYEVALGETRPDEINFRTVIEEALARKCPPIDWETLGDHYTEMEYIRVETLKHGV